MEYSEFIQNKRIRHLPSGINVSTDALNPKLFEFQKVIVKWCLERGKSCLAASTGLGKTFMELEWAAQIGERTLLIAPLGVAKQTEREAVKWGYDARYSKCEADTKSEQIVVTNYERLHLFDADKYNAVILDEASIIKSFVGKTRNMVMDMFANTPYKLPATATPSPNDYMELGNQAEFVGAMSRNEMLAMFFTHDGGKTPKWRLKGHCEEKFWEWCASWMVALQSPSDLGFPNDDYALPPLHIFDHVVDYEEINTNSLFPVEAVTLSDQRSVKKHSLSSRVDSILETIAKEPERQWLIWCELNPEGDLLEKVIPGAVQIAGKDKEEFKENAMLDFIDGRIQNVVTKASIFGWGMNIQNCKRQVFSSIGHSFESRYQAIRRSWRFGQDEEVHVHQFYAEQEGAILRNLKRKQEQSEKQIAAMVAQIQSANGLLNSAQKTKYVSDKKMIVPTWLK